MKILTGSLLLSLTIWCSPAISQTDQRAISPTEKFSVALQKFKTKDYNASRTLWSELLAQNPNDPSLLYNLGLVEANDNHPERAYAYWRKALYLSPGHAPSLEGISSLQPSVADYPLLLWIYWRVPIAILCIIAFALWCLCGVLIVRNIRRSKKGQEISWTKTAVVGVIFMVFAALAAHDYWTLFESPAGTLLANTPALASPTSEAPSVFEFREGDDVTVLRKQNEWLQVQRSETAVGWIKNSALLLHSGI